jgi:hypothetical protein
MVRRDARLAIAGEPMTMSLRERAEFVNGYTRVLIATWSNDEFAQRLDSDTAAALRECGIDVPAGSVIEVLRDIPDGEQEGNLDVQIETWERGLETGHYRLHIPDTPQIDSAELTESDLDSIMAGMGACCCCCPCCCGT